jgi:hypothetical protein
MALATVNLQTGAARRLTTPSFNVVGFPSVDNNIIYFTASYGGNDDVFAIKPGDPAVYQLTDGALGSYFVNVADGKMTWSSYTADGYQLREIDTKELVWTAIPAATVENTGVMYPVSHTGDIPALIPGNVTARNFPVTKYSKGTKLFNFHSWRPYYEDPIFTFSLYGENVLNTLQTEIYYQYNQNDRRHAAGVNATFGAWFPYLSVGTQMTFARQDSVSNLLRQWNQLDTRIGINVPLNFAKGQTYHSFNIGTNYFLRNEFITGPNKDQFGPFDFTYLHHFISWSQQVQTARQHIFPRLGYAISANYRYAATKIEGHQFLGNAAIYLPGVFANHHLVLTGGFQQRDTLRALFSSGLATARGYEDYYRTTAGSRLWRLSANYHLPLFIPDWGFGNILYLQRIRGNAFYDMQRVYSNNKRFTADFRSVGGEVYFDTKWWNQYELTFGFRVSHILDDDPLGGNAKGSNIFEFILPISIIPK